MTRWQKFFQDDSELGAVPPSFCAQQAAKIFAQGNCRVILDLGCGAGRDSLCLARSGAVVIGLDAARSGLLLAQQHDLEAQISPSWVEADARFVPFSNSLFDAVYCFGMLHEFVGETAAADVTQIMAEIYRVLKPWGTAVVAVAAGDPDKGLPMVQNFTEAMFDDVTRAFHLVEKRVYDDLGCTGRKDYKVWFGHFKKDQKDG